VARDTRMTGTEPSS